MSEKIYDLSGEWEYRTDPDDCGITEGYCEKPFPETDGRAFRLPGSSCECGIGRKWEYDTDITPASIRAPREKYEYIGPLWLRRRFTLSEADAGKRARLFLERVNIASEVWVDDVKAGRQKISLSTPHIHELGVLAPGEHTLTLRIDNRNLLNFGDMASGYSVDTQGIWCGAVGRIELSVADAFRAENVQIYPRRGGARVSLTAVSELKYPSDRLAAEFEITVRDGAGNTLCAERYVRTLYNGHQPESFDLVFDAPEWDEFHPHLCTLTVSARSDAGADEKTVRFGNRTVGVRDKRLTLNGRPIFLRGTVDCAQFPLTGYPATDIGHWRRYFATLREWGMNHVRFHAWCPPESAFAAADEAGFYVSVEMPLWINRDVTPLSYGDDDIHDIFYPREAKLISKTYGNHPSFIMFSNGNETLGDFELLSDITTMMRAYDARRLYTLTSNFDHPTEDCEDYICAQTVSGRDVRIQNMHGRAAADTCLDYGDAVRDTRVPIVSFEVGQYCSFPDVDICERYTGNMLPVNFDAIRKRMVKSGTYGLLREYVRASGKLAARFYKEDIETALRTEGFGGFQLLSLLDYTGQSTATVGMLDIFGENKGFISPDEFRRFCGPVVPLFRAKRIYKNTETLTASLGVCDFGERGASAEPYEYDLTILANGEPFYSVKTRKTSVSVPLSGISRPAMLSVTLAVEEYSNSWRVFVYPEDGGDVEFDVPVVTVRGADGLRRAVERGESVIVSAEGFEGAETGSFVPVFWSPALFPTKRPSGVMIDAAHPIFGDFPTEDIPDYQWKTLLDRSRAVDISDFPDARPIIEIVPNFMDCTRRSPLFEFGTGKGRVLFCGFDIFSPTDDLPTAALRRVVAEYMRRGSEKSR